jgi:hypothetical protein
MKTVIIAVFGWVFGAYAGAAVDPLDPGSRRELFMDDYLMASMENVQILVHAPVRKELAMNFNKPWEGSATTYNTVFFDGETYRMYYAAWQAPKKGEPLTKEIMSACCAVSDDGIHWKRPNLGLNSYNDQNDTNILFPRCYDFTAFLDTHPAAVPEAKYKGLAHLPRGLVPMQSADGVHWEQMGSNKALYRPGTLNAFDSQSNSFWSESEEKYVLYYRVKHNDVRHVERAVSDDYIHWVKDGLIEFPEGEGPRKQGQFYTNQIRPYYRAPHIYIGFPARYTDHGQTVSRDLLPELEERNKRAERHPRFGSVTTDSVYILSRDGIHFRQSNDVYLAPGLKTKGNWSYGDNYIASGMLETTSANSDEGREISIFASESRFTGTDTFCRRYVLRVDGFASLHAKTKEGVVTTKPLVFRGKELSLNVATSARGTVRVEICDANGEVIPSFGASECDVIYGDTLDRRVSWNGNKDVSSLAGRPVFLRFIMMEADLYSLIFEL